jgi:HK97 family phage prohead protease
MLPIPEDLVNTDRTRDCLIANNGGIELRAVTPLNDQPGFDGYILTWNTVDDRGTFFTKGSAKKSIKERGMDAPHLWMHQAGSFFGGDVPLPIGKHLAIEEDDIGVRVSVALNEDQTKGAEVLSALRFGNKLGLSFGFDRLGYRSADPKKDNLDLSVAPDWVKSVPINELIAITEFRFWESSSVIFGSNAKAKPTKIRSLFANGDPNDWEQFLSDLRAGRLDEQTRAHIDQIVAAEQERAAAGQNHGTQDLDARRNLDVEFAFLWGDDQL